MTDREKLVRLIQDSVEGCAEYWAGRIADHLIAHGVTVREMQKPMALNDATGTMEPVWYENYRCNHVVPADVVYSERCNCIDVYKLGAACPLPRKEELYGKTWRCWAEKPRPEERKAAEWE